MAALRPEDLDHVARIARIPLSPEERARLAREAGAILAHFESVEAALARAAQPLPLPPLEPRADEPRDPEAAQVEAIVAQFPRKVERLAKVPEGL